MTLVLKLDPDIIYTYHHTKNKVSMSRHSKVTAQTEDKQTHTHTQYENITFPHTRAVITSSVGKRLKWDYCEYCCVLPLRNVNGIVI